MPYRGKPLLHHAIARVAAVCGEVVVVLATGADAGGLPSGVRAAHDPAEGEGPLAGAHAGLLAAGSSPLAMLVGGDMPELEPAVLRAMLEEVERTGADAVALQEGDRARPLPLAVRTGPAAIAAHTLLQNGRRSLHELMHELRAVEIDEPTWTALDPGRTTLRDVDEPADLEA